MRSSVLMLLLMLCVAGQLAATPVYVGSFQVDQGPWWGTSAPAYSGQQAAALIYGGSPSDYWISTTPGTITHTAWYSTWGGACGTYPCGTVYAENFVHNTGGYYAQPGDVSAYIRDWATGPAYTNYVWQAEAAAPEPTTLGLGGAALIGLVVLRRRIPARRLQSR